MTYANPQLLIEPAELGDRIGDRALRVYDATVLLKPAEKGYRAESGLEAYLQGHIRSAAFMDQIEALSDTSTGLGFTLPGEDYLQSALRKLGIDDDSQVVIYSTGHMMWATRAWWLLHYAGHSSVRVLNGGFTGWQAVDGPVSQQDESYEPGDFTLRAQPSKFVDQAGVLAAIGDPAVCTVNALNPGVYAGSAAMSYGRKGHITGSINLFYDDLLDGDRFRDAQAITDSLRAHKLLEADRVVTYCGGGISATIDAFACLLVGKEEVAVYDGSMSEWVRDESLPMTEGEMPD